MRRNIRCCNCTSFSKALNSCMSNAWSCPHSDPVADMIKTFGCIDCSGIFDIDDGIDSNWTYTCIDCGKVYKRKVMTIVGS